MLEITRPAPHLCDGLTRRDWLRLGAVGAGGLTLPGLLQSQAQAAGAARAKSVILLFNTGGIPHHETWDPKPQAPREVRGDFGVIPTRTPGMFVGELMPKTALLTDRIAVVRTMATGDNAHSTSGYQMLTGVPHIPLSQENTPPRKPNDWPCANALVRALRPPRGGLPSSIMLPRKLANMGGLYPWPGADAGFLGRKYDPWVLECNPAEPNFSVPDCQLPDDLPPLRLDRRLSLLDQFNRHADRIEQSASVANYDEYKERAIELIAGGRARQAFDLGLESEDMRDRYGPTRYGQSVLLARRLVEAGVSLVQVNWASEDRKRPNSGGWDTHEKHSESLKGWLMPVMDQVYSSLLTDLDERGLLDETLVCWVAEFGHTPKFNKRAGRDHWGRVFSIALAGGGIRGGTIVGATDSRAAEPLSTATSPADYLATVFHCLGYSPETMVHDPEGRPLPISRGRIIDALV